MQDPEMSVYFRFLRFEYVPRSFSNIRNLRSAITVLRPVINSTGNLETALNSCIFLALRSCSQNVSLPCLILRLISPGED